MGQILLVAFDEATWSFCLVGMSRIWPLILSLVYNSTGPSYKWRDYFCVYLMCVELGLRASLTSPLHLSDQKIWLTLAPVNQASNNCSHCMWYIGCIHLDGAFWKVGQKRCLCTGGKGWMCVSSGKRAVVCSGKGAGWCQVCKHLGTVLLKDNRSLVSP